MSWHIEFEFNHVTTISYARAYTPISDCILYVPHEVIAQEISIFGATVVFWSVPNVSNRMARFLL